MRGKIIISILFVLSFCCINTGSAQWVLQNNPTGNFINTAFFVNNNTGWVGSLNMGKTTDGGNNWTLLQPPENAVQHDIYFIDENTGFLASFNFWKTTNGGTNWTNSGLGSSNYTDIFFLNPGTGWTTGFFNGVSRTTNSGNTWTNIYQNPGINLESISFINANTGWACGYSGVIIKTTNGGVNWAGQTSETGEVLYSISFADANTGRAVGENATYLRTTNGGTNWTSVAGPFAGTYQSSLFINSSTGWVGGVNGLAFTSNNGTSWINQTPPFGTTSINAISYISPSTVFLGSLDMFKSTSGGFNIPAPSNLTLTPATTSAINLSWTDNTTDEDKFMIERSDNGTTGWTVIDSVGANVTSYQNTGLPYNEDFYYRVYAKKMIFTGGTSNEARMAAKLTPPVNSSPLNDILVTNPTPTLTWSSVSGGFVYDCQIATDAAFTNIIYTRGNGGPTSQTVPPGILQNSTKYYWRSKAINFLTYSDYSTVTNFTVQDSNYGHNRQTGNNLYYFANSTAGASLSPSKPTYNWRDTTGSIDLIVNQAGTPTAGNLDNGYFLINNIFGGSNKTKFFGTDYSNVYIGTNGIISFSTFTPTAFNAYALTDAGIPQSDIPTAIFPFWTDLYFQSGAVGSRLSYKVTPTEVIITYSKAQVYAPGHTLNNNLYISFQVVIQHSASPSVNSKIDIFYNYAETGSDFITRMNNNTLPRHLVGLQGSNSASQVANYRFENSSYLYPYSGPIFGSNLALSFGPDASLLPVELASFTSQINGSNVKLNWSTVNELNNSGFDIERKSSAGNDWKKISFIQGSGTTNESKNYSYEDRNVTSGKYNYRLKQIDFNGNYEYHALANEVEIGVPKKFSLSQNYPNPFNPATKINFELPRNSIVKLSVFDVTGKLVSELVNEQRAAGYYTVEFNGSNLASGMYFYRIQTGDFISTKKMILVK